MFLRLAIRLIVPNRETHQIHQVFWFETKCSKTNYMFLLSLSTLLFLLYMLSIHWFIHLLYISNNECSKDMREEHSSAKYSMKNYENLKKCSRLKWCNFYETFRHNPGRKFLTKNCVLYPWSSNIIKPRRGKGNFSNT